MSDENKDNKNTEQPGKKSWWKNVGLKPNLQTKILLTYKEIILILLYILLFIVSSIISFISAFYFAVLKTTTINAYFILIFIFAIFLINYKFLKKIFFSGRCKWLALLFAYISVIPFALFFFVVQFIRF